MVAQSLRKQSRAEARLKRYISTRRQVKVRTFAYCTWLLLYDIRTQSSMMLARFPYDRNSFQNLCRSVRARCLNFEPRRKAERIDCRAQRCLFCIPIVIARHFQVFEYEDYDEVAHCNYWRERGGKATLLKLAAGAVRPNVGAVVCKSKVNCALHAALCRSARSPLKPLESMRNVLGPLPSVQELRRRLVRSIGPETAFQLQQAEVRTLTLSLSRNVSSSYLRFVFLAFPSTISLTRAKMPGGSCSSRGARSPYHLSGRAYESS